MVGSELAELKDMVLRQQAQLDLILKTLSTPEGAVRNVNRILELVDFVEHLMANPYVSNVIKLVI